MRHEPKLKMQKLLFLILSSISQGSTDNENSSLGRKIRSHGGEGESDYNPYDSPMFQFIQDLTEEEIVDLPEETLWDISQFYKNNPSLEPPPWFTGTTTGSTTTTTTAQTTTSLSVIPVTFPIMQMAMDNTPPWLNPDFTTTPITTTSIQSSTSAFIMQNTPPAVSTENQQIANQAASATNNFPMSSQTLTPSPGVSQRKFDQEKYISVV